MPYIYSGAGTLHSKPMVGDGECVALIRHYTNAPPARTWRQGREVWGNKSIPSGTAIATFEKGRWPGRSKGNHAAFYIGQDSTGLYVIDQWIRSSDAKKVIRRRKIGRKNIWDDGTYETPSDNAFAYSIIE